MYDSAQDMSRHRVHGTDHQQGQEKHKQEHGQTPADDFIIGGEGTEPCADNQNSADIVLTCQDLHAIELADRKGPASSKAQVRCMTWKCLMLVGLRSVYMLWAVFSLVAKSLAVKCHASH